MNNEKLKKMLHAAEKYGADAVCEMVAEHTGQNGSERIEAVSSGIGAVRRNPALSMSDRNSGNFISRSSSSGLPVRMERMARLRAFPPFSPCFARASINFSYFPTGRVSYRLIILFYLIMIEYCPVFLKSAKGV